MPKVFEINLHTESRVAEQIVRASREWLTRIAQHVCVYFARYDVFTIPHRADDACVQLMLRSGVRTSILNLRRRWLAYNNRRVCEKDGGFGEDIINRGRAVFSYITMYRAINNNEVSNRSSGCPAA